MISFEEFWDEHFGAKFGFHDAFPTEPFYSIGEACWEGAENNAFKRQEAVCEKYARELDEFHSCYKERKRGIKWILRKFVSFFCNLRG